MASPQTQNGYIKIANEIAEILMRVKLTPNQHSILWAIWRKTFGWNKKSDQISLGQFTVLTGIKPPHVSRTLKELEKMNIITVDRISKMKIVYGFQKNYEKWLNVTVRSNGYKSQLLPHTVTTITAHGNKTITEHGKHKRHIKDNIVRNFLIKKLYQLISYHYLNLIPSLKKHRN